MPQNQKESLPSASNTRRLSLKRLWKQPWLILGGIIFIVSVIFVFMNNSEVTINFIGASMIIKLPMLIVICALIGAAIEFLAILGSRSDSRAEINRLKQQISEHDKQV